LKRALVVFAHGARDPAWAQPIEALALRLRERLPGVRIECAYLERMTPDLHETLDTLASAGCDDILLLPVFWAAQGHVDQVVPEAVDSLRSRGIVLRVLPVLSGLPGLLDFVADQAAGLAQP